MSTNIPSADEVRKALAPLTLKQLDRLAELSGVSAPTLAKIKYGQTEKPGLDTVRAFFDHIAAASEPAAQPGAPVHPLRRSTDAEPAAAGQGG